MYPENTLFPPSRTLFSLYEHTLCIVTLLSMGMCMCRLHALLLVCILLVSVSAEKEISVHTTIPLSCVAQWDTSSSNMHNVAYQWTHKKTITNWQYSEINAPSRPVPLTSAFLPEATCVHIAYTADVKLPSGFADYIPSQAMKTDIDKQLCSSINGLTEAVHFSNIIFLDTFTVTLRARIDNNKANVIFDSTCDIALPWFTQPLRKIIFAHISDSILEYMNILADSLCDDHS